MTDEVFEKLGIEYTTFANIKIGDVFAIKLKKLLSMNGHEHYYVLFKVVHKDTRTADIDLEALKIYAEEIYQDFKSVQVTYDWLKNNVENIRWIRSPAIRVLYT